MPLNGELEIEIEIKAPADKFYKIFRSQMNQLPKISSEVVHKGEVYEGDWKTVSSVKHWDYSLEGDALSVIETVEAVDEKNKSITFNILDGDVMKLYRSFKPTVQVTPTDEGGLVKWTLEYEKLNEDNPAPDAYLDLAAKVTKDVEAYLLKA